MAQWLGPLVDGVCLNTFPPVVTFKPVPEDIRNQTSARTNRYHRLGYHYIFTLTWGQSLCKEDQWALLKTIVNKDQSIEIRPYPDKYYNNVFTVHIVNGLASLETFRYIEHGYRGKITLETVEPFQNMPAWEESTA